MQIGEQTFCFFGKNSTIKGEFNLAGEIHINCQIEGTIKLETEDLLTVGPHAKIQGNIFAENVDIYGNFNGELNVSGKLRIFPSATVTGKISANSLIIKPGAQINMTGHSG